MHDPGADSQPTTHLKAGREIHGARTGPAAVDTQTESQIITEPESGIGTAGGGDVPDTEFVAEPVTEPEAEILLDEIRAAPGDDRDDRLLDLLAQWEERYHRDGDVVPDSLGVDDPALREALRDRIGRQKRLYAFMKHSPTEDAAGSEVLSGHTDSGRTATAPEVREELPDGPKLSPTYIGRYRAIRALGEGGFGRVHLAHDAELDRDVAIKVPLPSRAARFLDVESYLEEARIIARLSHPNIVPVYDVGRTEDGLCYVVSKYMNGGDLAARLGRGRLAFDEAAALVAVLCEALHYTHTHDLFHRDIKPANILLDDAGIPSLADFGLALKDEDLGKGARHVGTAAYMSPEQARGEGHRVDGRSDIFSIGIVFYELLTGRRPFRGGSKQEVMDQIVHAEPRPPRQIDDTIPRELERICLRALAKRASERYPTARDLAEDLRHFLKTASGAMATEVVSPAPVMVPAATEATPTPVPGSSDSGRLPIRIVPKGLGSFDEDDADFFLELLPGPRDRDGLPDGLRFWKTRIDTTDADKAFRVGLIYGPSGCGKSSMVKAGLLPLLGPHVDSVYIEATAGETESRLLRGIRKRFPMLPADAGLVESLATLRRGQILTPGRKTLVVLDQFEQWLFGRHAEPESELVASLRQCDGEHLQAICLVRDDFWMAATRFMKDLELDLVPDRNVAVVDLFDPKHARKVLSAYGRAFEALPPRPGDCSRDQGAFLDQAVAGLARDGWVVPVRLALFAEMIKRKPWTPATLRQVGGMDGVGVTFLEETFSSPRSNPNHRYHQKAAQAVLKALLPETNADIKGRMRSVEELRGLSGYAERTGDFVDLIRSLDSELRLITPVDPEGSIDEDRPALPTGTHGYQLTHDYLVHALRDWLTRKQRETRRGRAELLLTERAAFWSSKPEDLYLPSIREWGTIRLLTYRKDWKEPQRRMMQRAGRLIRLQGIIAALLLAGVLIAGLAIRHRVIEDRDAAHGAGLVQQLLKAETAQVPAIVREIGDYRRWTDEELRRVLRSEPDGSKRKFHASLALLPIDGGQFESLCTHILAADPTRMAVLRDSLTSYRGEVIERLWRELREASPGDDCILPVAGVLAGYDPSNPRWAENGDKVAVAMVAAKLDDVKGWREALSSARSALMDPLVKIFRDGTRDADEHKRAADFLAHYAENKPGLLVDLLLNADPKSFAILIPVVEQNSPGALTYLQSAVSDQAKDQPASRAAMAAVTLLRLGHADEVWPLLAYNQDPEVRSTFIAAINAYGVVPTMLATELGRLARNAGLGPMGGGLAGEKNGYLFDPVVSKQRALIQALAGYPKEALDPVERDALVVTLSELYRNDPDAGIHSATELVLRRWGYPGRMKIEPGRAPQAGEPHPRRWYMNSQGQTMVLIDGPVEFHMGSPPSDPDRVLEEETPHRRTIPRKFALASGEVTVAQFQRYAIQKLGKPHEYKKKYSPEPDGPMIGMNWFEAVGYCNWLSDNEGLPRCYEPNDKGEYAKGMRVNAEAVASGGYRLPTAAEWEYACRAGTRTSRYYGRTRDLLGRYGWHIGTSGIVAHPSGMLLPNDLGFFDMLGNVMEWSQDLHQECKPDSENHITDNIKTEEVSHDKRDIRGGTFVSPPVSVRAAARSWYDPWDGRVDTGFRPARTYP